MDIADVIDIKLDNNWQFAPDATGDFLQTNGKYECILQEIQLEALTQEGDLWYEEGFGWSLMDFIQAEADELTELEVKQRVLDKLGWYEEVDVSTINTSITTGEEIWKLQISFKFIDDDTEQLLQVGLDRINAEVVVN